MQELFVGEMDVKTVASDLLVTRLFGSVFDVFVDEAHNPLENMRLDHERAIACMNGVTKPMLRLYSWKPWAVSLGAHQSDKDISLQSCQVRGFDLVRRPTGGRAVLHANELTYSIVVPLATPDEPTRNIYDIYRDVHILLLKALHLLGAEEATFKKTHADLRSHYRRGGVRAVSCFSSSARYEIVWRERKIVGSAQKLYTPHRTTPGRAVLLQHGSILLGAGHEQLADVAYVQDESERDGIRSALRDKAATLEEICGQKFSFTECVEAILSVVYPVSIP